MTLLNINLTDVLLETDPGDKVIVWAPVLREGPAGQLVGTRRKEIPLTDGVGSDEVVPGPLMVQVQCKAMSDARPREVVVPEEGPVTLTALMDGVGAFTYAPPVIGQVAQLRDEVVQAATDADLAADRAEAGATTAAGHATQTADDRRQTGEDRTQTGLDRQAAAQSATDAATSATTAEGHKTTVQTALAGARLYSGTGFPNGVVAAPIGSIYTDTAATSGAIRWIKTSGTGNTGWKVEYGDTGLRDITTLLPGPWREVTGMAYIRRYNGNQVDLVLYNLTHAGAASTTILDLPDGFGGVVMYAMPRILFHTASAATFRSYFSTVRRLSALAPHPTVGSQSFGSVTYSTDDPWPVSLPGTPA